MSSDSFIFTSYCFGPLYQAQQLRLQESILKIYPEANLHFFNEPEETGKPKFQQSLYGYKVHLIKDCLQKGFRKIIYLDTAICLETEVDHWLNVASEVGVLAPVDRQSLSNVTSNNCLKYLNLSRDQVKDWNLVGGSIYIFDFNNSAADAVFSMWADLEEKGLFGTQDDLSYDRLQAHRMDETCMALSLYLNGLTPMGHDVMRYAYEHPETKRIHSSWEIGEIKPVCIKRHFK